MNQCHFQRLTILCLTAVVPALSQTTTPPPAAATCTTAPTSVKELNFERPVALSGLSSTATPSIPANIGAAIAAGTLELRQQFSWNSTTNAITITDFAAQPSSSSPTPPGNIQSSNMLSMETFTIDKIYSSCTPTPSLLIVGTITANNPASPVGSLVGVPAAISVGYTTDTPAKINNAVIVYAGIASIYSAGATGTLTFPTTPVTPPGSNAGAPVINVGGGANQTTSQKQIALDFSQSTSPLNLQVSFNTVQISPPLANGEPGSGSIPQAAVINNAGTAQPLITFAGGKGTYAFQVTATDSAGHTSSKVIVVQYYGI